jgi:ketosteroid isomerase-like protein
MLMDPIRITVSVNEEGIMSNPLRVVDRLVAATNAHDIEALVECFSPGYVNQTPAHPRRGFGGRDQVRRNWTSIFAGVPDIRAEVVSSVVDEDDAWTEWAMSGTRLDGAPHAMVGVIIFGVRDDHIVSARFYLEPVEQTSGDVNAAVDHAVRGPTP